MEVVAIVVTYNRCELLRQVLSSLKKQTVPPYKIIIINNNSSDNTDQIANKYIKEDSSFIYYNTKENLGGAGGFHKGFELAEQYTYDYLWLMDDDLLPAENCLENLISGKPKGIVQPIRFNKDGSCAEMSPVIYDLKKILCKNPKLYSIKDIFEQLKSEKSIDIATVPFEGPLISRDVVSVIGSPNPNFFITGDDTDYSLRATKFGFTIQCILKAHATRLLIHNQNEDFFTWKGYFILRNHFYILRNYGANIFVRQRPIFILFYFAFKSVLRRDFIAFKKVISAYMDSFTLANNEKHKPK